MSLHSYLYSKKIISGKELIKMNIFTTTDKKAVIKNKLYSYQETEEGGRILFESK